MAGRATFTTVLSINAMLDARIAAARIHGSASFAHGLTVCPDSIAAWFLARSEEGGTPWETLRDLSEIGFAEWVAEARRTSGLHNDDVTLVHVDIW